MGIKATVQEGINKLIDAKYTNLPNHLREKLKQKTQDKLTALQQNGMDVTLQIYDKTAKSQAAKFMHKEPLYF